MGKVDKEARRLVGQVGNFVRHGRFNSFPRTQRKAKPDVLRAHPEWEIRSSLEFMAAHAVDDIGDLCFVQIGAFDGEFDDPLAVLIRKYGWRGVLVEPQPAAVARLQENYADQPQLSFENAAIGDAERSVTMYTVRDGATPMASLDRRHLLRHCHRAAEIVEHQVPCLTLEALLRKHPLPRVDLLQIDAEGYDGQILRSINFDRLRPQLIRYEHANLVQSERNDCIQLLVSHDYRILLEDSDTIAYREDG